VKTLNAHWKETGWKWQYSTPETEIISGNSVIPLTELMFVNSVSSWQRHQPSLDFLF
jgi:hypothetical protein